MIDADIRVFPDAEALAAAAAAGIAEAIRARPGRFSLALSGGNTPRGVYARLAAMPDIDWRAVHFFWSDERFVPSGGPASNFHLAEESLLRPARVPAGNVHPVDVMSRSADEAAEDYDRSLREFFGGAPRFDLVLLGLGDDGHTASLFPGSPALLKTDRWAVAVHGAPKPPPDRISLTLPALAGSKAIYFLASGPGKAAAVRRVLAEGDAVLPAGRVRPRAGRPVWWLDREAAKNLSL